MKTSTILGISVLSAVLAGCQTLEQKVEARSKLVCFQAGYGTTSPRHQECMDTLKPVAMDLERRKAWAEATDGLGMIAAGVAGNQGGVTCVSSGSVTRCR